MAEVPPSLASRLPRSPRALSFAGPDSLARELRCLAAALTTIHETALMDVLAALTKHRARTGSFGSVAKKSQSPGLSRPYSWSTNVAALSPSGRVSTCQSAYRLSSDWNSGSLHSSDGTRHLPRRRARYIKAYVKLLANISSSVSSLHTSPLVCAL